MCPLPSLGLEPDGVRNCQRSRASGRSVVQCATNDKISSVWPFINICGFSVLGRDRKLRSAQRKGVRWTVTSSPHAWSRFKPVRNQPRQRDGGCHGSREPAFGLRQYPARRHPPSFGPNRRQELPGGETAPEMRDRSRAAGDS